MQEVTNPDSKILKYKTVASIDKSIRVFLVDKQAEDGSIRIIGEGSRVEIISLHDLKRFTLVYVQHKAQAQLVGNIAVRKCYEEVNVQPQGN